MTKEIASHFLLSKQEKESITLLVEDLAFGVNELATGNHGGGGHYDIVDILYALPSLNEEAISYRATYADDWAFEKFGLINLYYPKEKEPLVTKTHLEVRTITLESGEIIKANKEMIRESMIHEVLRQVKERRKVETVPSFLPDPQIQFHYLNFPKLKKLPLEELNQYYRKLRLYQYEQIDASLQSKEADLSLKEVLRHIKRDKKEPLDSTLKSFQKSIFINPSIIKELILYYEKHHEYKKFVWGLAVRKKLYPLFRWLLGMERVFLGQTLRIIKDQRWEKDCPLIKINRTLKNQRYGIKQVEKRSKEDSLVNKNHGPFGTTPVNKKNNRPTIYNVSHIGRYDIETSLWAIKEPAALVMGDRGESYRNIDALILSFIKTINFDTTDKLDRRLGEAFIKLHLQHNYNVAMYGEGAWNVTPNEIAMKLYDGPVRIAKEEEANLVALSTEQYGKHFDINISDYQTISNEDQRSNRELSNLLRDLLCTLKWDIWRKYPITKRVELPANYDQVFVDTVMAETDNGYTLDVINATKYHDPNITLPEEVYAFRDKLASFSAKDLKKVKYNKR